MNKQKYTLKYSILLEGFCPTHEKLLQQPTDNSDGG